MVKRRRRKKEEKEKEKQKREIKKWYSLFCRELNREYANVERSGWSSHVKHCT